eukprot:3494914-Prymnesium_polylepis.2
MWKAGIEPPASVQLSASAAAEVWRLRAWGNIGPCKGCREPATPAHDHTCPLLRSKAPRPLLARAPLLLPPSPRLPLSERDL